MAAEGFFLQALVYLAAAVVAVPVAKRLGLGSVLGYLIAGVVIGPFGFGFIGTEGQDVMHFAEFGVVMMLFLVGLELEPSLLWRLRAPIVGMGGLQVALTAAAVMVVTLAAGLGWRTGLTVGFILAMSSTAIVLQTLNEKGLMKTSAGQSSFAVLLFQDISVIPILALFPLLAPGLEAHDAGGAHGSSWVDGLPAWAYTVAVLAAVAVVVLAGRLLVGPAFRAIARTRLREIFTAAALLLVIATALLMTKVGLSPALGTFLAGVVLANSEYRHELVSDVEPFKGLLLGLFFIAVGASIDFHLVARSPGLIAGLVLATVVLKLVVLAALGFGFRLGTSQALAFSFALAQVGEFAFVLISFASQLGSLTPDLSAPLVAAVALSMALSPVLMAFNERVLQPRVGTRRGPERVADTIDEHTPVIIAGFGRFGQIVGRLLKANGVRTTVLDVDSDRVDLLRRLGLKVFFGDASRYDLLHAAGAEHARLLVLALDSPEKTLELVHTARKHFPHLTVMARAFDREDAGDLLDAGVAHVYRDTLDTSLRLGIDALRVLGVRSYQAHRAARIFRQHDEESVHLMKDARKDRAATINIARQRIADLEAVLIADQEDQGRSRDEGWDVESLREDARRDTLVPSSGESG
jgi:monovalent cation:proton antiporter-2 (CPA2) family protein